MPEKDRKNSSSWTLYSDNQNAWDSILKDCSNAKKSIVLEQFIFATDEFGQKLIDICAERASKGVSVKFLWDAAGSFTFWGSNIVEDMRKKGIQLQFWRTLIPSYFKIPNYRSWYLRNHRRTLVIDGEIGYTGSMCIQNEFKNWRDTNVRLEGYVVGSMQNAFDRMWARALKHRPLPPRVKIDNSEFLYITNFPAPGKHEIYEHLVTAMRLAKKYIYITSPYFVPPHRMLKTIRTAAKKGVKVKIILPEKTDHYPTLDIAARSFFSTLLESGVEIFLYKGNLIHSKAVTIDGTWATVGSLNLDNASLLYNYEANIVTTNDDFAIELTDHFNNDLTNSIQVDRQEWKNRFFMEKIPEFLIRLVRKFL